MLIPASVAASAQGHTLNVYLLPGLGLNAACFESLVFPGYCRVSSITLFPPEKAETLHSYAGRLLQRVDENLPFVLAGMSFGGVLAAEMNRIRPAEAVILLSSIRHSGDLPYLLRLSHKMRLTRVIPYPVVEQLIRLFRSSAPEEKRRLYQPETLRASYLSWSVNNMLDWNPGKTSGRFYQVHGKKDRLLPCRRRAGTWIVAGARHLLLPEKQEEVNRITAAIFSELAKG